MIVVEITEELRERARCRLAAVNIENHHFQPADVPRSAMVGMLGEYVVLKYLYGDESFDEHQDTKDYDIDFFGTLIDVKTKRGSGRPKPYYNAAVVATQHEQGCDVYCFVRILEDMTEGYPMGWIKKSEFYEIARMFHKGDQGENGYVYPADCYEVRYDELNPMERMKVYFNAKGEEQ
jgi:hypothetical protein